MAVPGFQDLMLPMLELHKDGADKSTKEIEEALSAGFKLTQEERGQLLPSGKQPRLYNRLLWARTYLKSAGLLEKTGGSTYRITDKGRQVLQERPKRVDMKYLMRFPEYVAFRGAGKPENLGHAREGTTEVGAAETRTPEEILEETNFALRDTLARELTSRIKTCSPTFFERLVVEVLVRMGYGGSHKEAARAVGTSGDGGIDGIIDEDRLGLDTIYVQAKRWDGAVSRPEIQKFVGALAGRKAKKGIFITSSSFTNEAQRYADQIENRVVLIDGKRLAELMMDYNVGVTTRQVYEVKRIDSDFFEEG